MQFGAPATAMRELQELLAYWAAVRSGRRLPRRADIDPVGFKRLLPTVSLIDVQTPADGVGPRDYRLRLAGTGLYSVYGGEITGKRLGDVYSTHAAEYWRRELDRVVEERKPQVGQHSLAWRGAGHMSLMWIRLPLASNGTDVDMILGYDAIVGHASDGLSGIRAA
jgi:hypothetical protein